jgi:hypothetical protein
MILSFKQEKAPAPYCHETHSGSGKCKKPN